ncbi:MAG TPA: PIG-L family deacetylase [Vicinamibacterales bacterium]|nr:PIG-L family deacetylase [Vicinamibacterales bacterium]
MKRPAVLFCFAHPDDESFSGAGTAMRCAAAGARIVLVTATLGERGKAGDPPLCAPEELANYRERELREAARIIGFDELHLLGFRDRELAAAPVGTMRRALVDLIRRVRPDVVVTFDPNGFNAHPDHVAISRFTSDAIAAAADPRWYPDTGSPHTVQRLLWTSVIAPWDAAKRDRCDDLPGVDFIVDVSAWRERRAAALRAHRTQHLSVDKYFFQQPDPARILDIEIWRQAWGPALLRRPEDDILAGLS